MAGFDNEVVYGSNVDFRGTTPIEGQVTANGEILIGSSLAPNIRVGTLTSLDGTITITNGPGTIDISASDTADVQTLTGNTGGPVTPIGGTINVVTSNSTVKFAGTAGTETLDFGLTNLLIGSSGTAITSATSNVAVGTGALASITSATNNTCVGAGCGGSITSAIHNTCVGYLSGAAITTGASNVAVGFGSLNKYTTGAINAGSNVAIGSASLSELLTGVNNTCIGTGSGGVYTSSESSNVCVGSIGVTGDSHTIRIGDQGSASGQQTDCYLAGVLHTTSGRTVNVTGPGAYPYTALTTDYLIIVDTSSARTINLLASPTLGRTYVIKDHVGSAAANNITVSGNGVNIDSAASYTINSNYGSITVIYNGGTWSVV